VEDVRTLAIAYRVARAVAVSAEARASAARAALVSAMRGAESVRVEGCAVHYKQARLEPCTDWTEVAIALRDELKIPMAAWSGIVDKCTHERHSQRRIDVRLKKETP